MHSEDKEVLSHAKGTQSGRAADDRLFARAMQRDAADALIAHAVKTQPLPALAPDFAAQLSQRLHNDSKVSAVGIKADSALELWVSAGLLLVLGAGGVRYASSILFDTFAAGIQQNLPMILTAVAIVALVKAWEWQQRRRGPFLMSLM
ncbi:MAG: hypothetical protein V4603_08840 [Pseudomonadota bacterium]